MMDADRFNTMAVEDEIFVVYDWHNFQQITALGAWNDSGRYYENGAPGLWSVRV